MKKYTAQMHVVVGTDTMAVVTLFGNPERLIVENFIENCHLDPYANTLQRLFKKQHPTALITMRMTHPPTR